MSETPSAAERERNNSSLFIPGDFLLAELSPPDMWDRMISIAVREQASDLHLAYQADGMHVAVRLDGRLVEQGVLPAPVAQRVTNHVKVLAALDVAESRMPQDGSIKLTLDGRMVELRISLVPTNHGQDLAIRILDRQHGLRTVDDLGVLPTQHDRISELLDTPSGLILVTGATGAGKTTTLYALLQELAAGSRKIITIENPVEYDLAGINQTEVNYRIGLDYAALLRSVLRQDPNVLMIGEIRDTETADAVVHAANSGRLVLATSHAVHVAAALESLLSFGVNARFLARAFRGAIAQTLVRRLCPYCTERFEETCDLELVSGVEHLLEDDTKPALSLGRGCAHCRQSGYRGRVGLFEVLVADDAVRAAVINATPARELYAALASEGMITIDQAGKVAALQGKTSVEELLAHVNEIWTAEP